MDNDKLNLGTFVPKDTSSQSVRGTEVSWCAEALARWTVGRPRKTCLFFFPGRYTPLKIWYGYPRLLYFQSVTFFKPSFFVKCLRMFFWVYRGVHLFFILALYVWKNLLCFIWFISSVTRCIFPHVYIHHIIDMYVHPLDVSNSITAALVLSWTASIFQISDEWLRPEKRITTSTSCQTCRMQVWQDQRKDPSAQIGHRIVLAGEFSVMSKV